MKYSTSYHLFILIFLLGGTFMLPGCEKSKVISFSGTIKDKTTGAPVEGAFIDLYIDDWSNDGTGSPYPSEAISDKEGKFTIYFEETETRRATMCCVSKKDYRPKHSFADSKIGERQYDVLLQPLDGLLKVTFVNKSGLDQFNFVAYNSLYVDKPYFNGNFFLSRYPLKLPLDGNYTESISMPAGVYAELFWGKSWAGPYRNDAPHQDSVFIKRDEVVEFFINY